ncbi:PREDICTED: protein MGARP [Gekko japonicus]|uniref:Protein MGARP n=1 Tax=Gekko japonicus TaxID=146911 RepID=A0ABM1K067_GEKJA|nr:PREDICTED: protein MGARP [Gekko japonicus]
MPLCRVAWQTLTSRFARAAPQLRTRVPFRQMSSVPGSSGENMLYSLFVVGAAGAGIFYAYRVIISDRARYNERIEQIQQRNTEEWKPKPWPPPSLESDDTDEMETKEVTDTNEEAKGTAAEETEGVVAGKSEVQSEERAESTESEKAEESPAEGATSSVPGGEQDAPANSETSQDQG